MPHVSVDLTAYVRDTSIRRRYLKFVDFCKHGKSCKACHWLWKGSTDTQGYGGFFICWIPVKPRRLLRAKAHRFMFTLRYGHTDLFVLHTCDIPACNNYNHLYAGTQKDNVRDRDIRLRSNYINGEDHILAKLKEKDIRRIFYLKREGYTQRHIGEIMKVNEGHISKIIHGKVWKHIKL